LHQLRNTTLATTTWTGSEAEAISMGGHLAAISDKSENDWIVNTFEPSAIGAQGLWIQALWIGLNDANPTHTWGWSNGEPLTYQNWDAGEPNFPLEYYGQMYVSGNGSNRPRGTWNNTLDDCWGNPLLGVVEVVPEPATLGMLAIGAMALLRRRR